MLTPPIFCLQIFRARGSAMRRAPTDAGRRARRPRRCNDGDRPSRLGSHTERGDWAQWQRKLL